MNIRHVNAQSVPKYLACGCDQVKGQAKQEAAAPPQDQVSLNSQPLPKNEPPTEEPPPQEPPPEEPPAPPANVKVSVYPQDPYVSGPIVMEIEREKIGTDMSGHRVRVVDRNRPKATPDAEGNYLLAPGSNGISQVNAHTITYKTLELFEKYRGSEINWAVGSPTLEVVPHKQEGRNAYYSRWEGSTNYFYWDSQGLNTEVKTANSTDVVSHETGHALLDGLRPGFFGTWDAETGAFHEAFGDCAAMLFNLEHTSNRGLIQEQTGGSLRHHNALSSLAEEFGAAVKIDNDNPDDDHKAYLRTALNSFTYVPPEQLPPGRGDEDNLGREVHSFSRLFSGAFYDVIEAVYMQSIYEDKQCPQDALKTAADVTGPLLVRSIESGSTNRARFKQIALGMLAADQQLNEGKYSETIKNAFLAREIVTPEDFDQEEIRLNNLPDLTLTQSLNKEQAAHFVGKHADTLGLPQDLPLEAVSAHTNDRGEQFLSLKYTQEVPVTVDGFEDFVTDVSGGVTLVFGADGKLLNFDHTAIDDKFLKEEMFGIGEMKDSNSILTHPRGENIFTSENGNIFKAVVRGQKLVRVPISSCPEHGHHHEHPHS